MQTASGFTYLPLKGIDAPGPKYGRLVTTAFARRSFTTMLVRPIVPVLLTMPVKVTVWPFSMMEGEQFWLRLKAGGLVSTTVTV